MDEQIGHEAGALAQRQTMCEFEQAFSNQRIIAKLNDLLEATKIINALVVHGKSADKPLNDFIEVPDNRIRLDAMKLVCELRGLLRRKMELSGPDGGPITYDSITPAEREMLLDLSRGYMQKLEARSGKKGGKA